MERTSYYNLDRGIAVNIAIYIIMSPIDKALSELEAEQIAEYEEVIELWITYGGD